MLACTGVSVSMPFVRPDPDALEPPREATTELVLSVCTENLAFVDRVAHRYDVVNVLDKCIEVRGAPLRQFKSDNVRVQNIPNVGSCDGAFLTYLLDRWDDLPDIVEFGKGSLVGTVRGSNLEPLSCPSCESSGCDTADWKKTVRRNGNNSPLKHVYKAEEILPFNFSIAEYNFRYNEDVSMVFKRSGFSSMGEWMDHAPEPLSRQMYLDACCARNYGGHFAATREQIKNEAYFEGRARDLYTYLHSIQSAANEEVDHYIERTWMSVFCARNHSVSQQLRSRRH